MTVRGYDLQGFFVSLAYLQDSWPEALQVALLGMV